MYSNWKLHHDDYANRHQLWNSYINHACSELFTERRTYVLLNEDDIYLTIASHYAVIYPNTHPILVFITTLNCIQLPKNLDIIFNYFILNMEQSSMYNFRNYSVIAGQN